MASIRKRGKAWAVGLYVQGKREHHTLPTKAEAVAWAMQREAELTGARLPDRTLDDALLRYSRDIAPTLKSETWAILKIGNFRKFPLARKRLTSITGPDLAQWRDERLRQVKPGTVNREMNLLSAVFHTARRDWGWLKESPLKDVRRPVNPPARRRRISAPEEAALLAGLGQRGSGPPETVSQRVALAFLFALETAMRGGEIVRLQWADLGAKSVTLPHTKNGDRREVPLSKAALAILALLPRNDGSAFGLTDRQRDTLFRAGRARAGVVGVNFHDARAEAIWRLSKKLDVMELARMIGHRDINSLLRYYAASPEELADKLG